MGTLKHFLDLIKKQRSIGIAACIICAITIMFYYDVVFLNKTLLSPGLTAGVMGDSGPYGFTETTKDIWVKYAGFLKDLGSNAWEGEPLSVKIMQTFRQGALPLWNDNIQVGKPLAANFLASAFYPLKLVVYLLPTAVGWDIYLLLRFAIGAFFTYLFLRQMDVKQFPSIIGGVSFSFSGYFVLFQNIQNMDVDLLAPLLFWVIAYFTSFWKRTAVSSYQYLISVAAVVTVLLSNIPESLLLLLVAGFFFWLYRLVSIYKTKGKKIGNKSLIISLRIVLPAVLFVMPLYLLNAEFVQNAFSLHTSELGVGKIAWKNISYFINVIIPFISSPNFLLPSTPVPVATLNYFGIVGYFILFFGVFNCFRERGTRLFIFLIGVVVIAKIYGYPNILNEFIGGFPGLDRILYIKYANLLVSFVAACLIGFGLDSLIRGKIKRIEFIASVALFVSSIVWGIHVMPDANLSDTNIVLIAIITLFLTTGTFILVFSSLSSHRALLGGVMGFLLIAELFLLTPRHARPDRYESFTTAPYISFLQKQSPPFRIFAYNRLLYPQLSSAFDIDDIRDVDGLYVDKYFTYIKTFISPDVYDRFTGAAGTGEEEPVRVTNNPFFDLLNVQYLITSTAPLEFSPRNEIIDAILDVNEETPMVRETDFTINGESKRTLLTHAPSSVCAEILIPQDSPYLLFYSGINQQAWDHKEADGVTFGITVNNDTVFSLPFNPNKNQQDRQWSRQSINLEAYAGESHPVCFTTDAGQSNYYDHSGWAGFRFASSPEESEKYVPTQYRVVYNDEVLIFENTDAFPRGFLIGNAILKKTEEEIVAVMQEKGFDPRKSAAVLERSDQPSLQTLDGERCVSNGIDDYKQPNPNRVSFTIDSPGNCLLVWSETDYPGWKVKVNGKKGTIYQTDLLLRGVPVSEGIQRVEFIYRPTALYAGMLGTVAGVLLMIWWAIRFAHEKEAMEKV